MKIIIEMNKSNLEANGWVQTDPSTNQYRKVISDNKHLFREDRVIDPLTGATEIYESEIDLNDYTQEQMFEDVRSFGYSFNTMCDWIDAGENLDLIAECIFEMEN